MRLDTLLKMASLAALLAMLALGVWLGLAHGTPPLSLLALPLIALFSIALVCFGSPPPRLRARHQQLAEEQAAWVAHERARQLASLLHAHAAPHPERPHTWQLTCLDGSLIAMATHPDLSRASIVPRLSPTPLWHTLSVERGPSWLTGEALLRPPRRTFFDYHDGLPGEPADWEWRGVGHVFEGMNAQEIARTKEAITHLPARIAIDTACATRVTLGVLDVREIDDALLASIRQARAYLARWWCAPQAR